jgi:hypothetical protein
MSFKENAQTALGYLIYLVIGALWVSGSIHSESKHDEGSVGWWIPPWGVYRGIEQFWHKYPVIDWSKKHDGDVRSEIYLLTEGAYKDANLVEINKSTEEFADKIKDYPQKEKVYLETAARAYIEFSLSSSQDVADSMNRYFETGRFNLKLSPRTDSLQKILIETYNLNDIIEPLDNKVKEEVATLTDSTWSKLSKKGIIEIEITYKNNLDAILYKTKSDMQRIYKNIFNEAY